jgi:hypothetical protein
VDLVTGLCRAALVVTFLLSAGAKAAGRGPWRAAVREFGVPAPLAPAVAVAVPLGEVLAALALLGDASWVRAGAALAVVLLAAFTVGITANLRAGRHPECNCFGQLSAKPLGWSSVARNAVLLVLALVVLLSSDAVAAGPWLADRTLTEVVLGTAVAVLAVALAVLARLFLMLMSRYGAVLLRVDALEEDLSAALGPRPAPPFALAGADGVTHTLGSSLPDHGYLVLVFGDAACVPCGEVVALLPGWAAEHDGVLRFLVVATGEAGAVAAKFGSAGVPVLLDAGGHMTATYGVDGTPAAVAVSPSGYVFAGPAYTPDGVAGLVATAAGTVEEHGRQMLEIGPPPVRVGDPLPSVTVLDASGAEVPFAVRDDSVVLFWDTTCHFASQIREQVAAWRGSADLVVVTRDAPGADLGFGDVTYYDPPMAALTAYQAPGTPSAIAVDALGRTASEVAIGGDAVLALLDRFGLNNSTAEPMSTTVGSTTRLQSSEETL